MNTATATVTVDEKLEDVLDAPGEKLAPNSPEVDLEDYLIRRLTEVSGANWVGLDVGKVQCKNKNVRRLLGVAEYTRVDIPRSAMTYMLRKEVLKEFANAIGHVANTREDFDREARIVFFSEEQGTHVVKPRPVAILFENQSDAVNEAFRKAIVKGYKRQSLLNSENVQLYDAKLSADVHSLVSEFCKDERDLTLDFFLRMPETPRRQSELTDSVELRKAEVLADKEHSFLANVRLARLLRNLLIVSFISLILFAAVASVVGIAESSAKMLGLLLAAIFFFVAYLYGALVRKHLDRHK